MFKNHIIKANLFKTFIPVFNNYYDADVGCYQSKQLCSGTIIVSAEHNQKYPKQYRDDGKCYFNLFIHIAVRLD